jgi:hypothetical protein
MAMARASVRNSMPNARSVARRSSACRPVWTTSKPPFQISSMSMVRHSWPWTARGVALQLLTWWRVLSVPLSVSVAPRAVGFLLNWSPDPLAGGVPSVLRGFDDLCRALLLPTQTLMAVYQHLPELVPGASGSGSGASSPSSARLVEPPLPPSAEAKSPDAKSESVPLERLRELGLTKFAVWHVLNTRRTVTDPIHGAADKSLIGAWQGSAKELAKPPVVEHTIRGPVRLAAAKRQAASGSAALKPISAKALKLM